VKKEVNVILVDGVNKQDFINDFISNPQIELLNSLSEIPSMIVMNIEESYIQTLSQDTRVFYIEENKYIPVPANLPPYYEKTKNITVAYPTTSNNGANYMPLQFYLNSDIITSSQTLGSRDTITQLPNARYFSRWTGKNVDIVSVEVGPVNASYVGLQDTHPDYQSIVTPGTSKIIPMNWPGLTSASNQQITSNSLLTDHARGVLSAAAGTVCGFAKKSSLRVAYLDGADNPVTVTNSIVSWHNSKPINPETGVKNPTIIISEYQYLRDRYTAIKIDDIESITDLSTTITRPGSSWGSDLTPFVSRNIIPWKLLDPTTNVWHWAVSFPDQFRFSSLQIALEQAWDAGIVVINPAGNNGGIYTKTSDPRLLGVYCTAASGSKLYSLIFSGDPALVVINDFTTLTSSTIYRPFVPFGPHGLDKGIDVAAGQNSESFPVLDAYTNRGPGIDIVGLGANTWTSYPVLSYVDGTWGMFSGTSCAAPTVVGICACMMERYFTYNKVWPTPNQIKSILLSEAKESVQNAVSTTWASVPTPDTNYSVSAYSNSFNKNEIKVGQFANGGYQFGDLVGTTTKRVFLNAQSFDRSQTQSKRPTSGKVYPRPRIKRTR
jgi:hypothetical protein